MEGRTSAVQLTCRSIHRSGVLKPDHSFIRTATNNPHQASRSSVSYRCVKVSRPECQCSPRKLVRLVDVREWLT